MRYFGSDKFLDPGTVYRSFSSVRSHLHCPAKIIVGESPGNKVRKGRARARARARARDSREAKEKLQNTGNDVVSRIRLR